MNWDDIRYFLTLCREGSVSRAGAALGVTHTTVARRIAALEQTLGTRLFDRSADGYAMTQVAENIFDTAVRMEERALAIGREVFGRDAALSGKLKLTAPYDFASNVLVSDMGAFRKTYPGIDLELLTTTGLLDMAAREADIAVRLTASPPEYLVGRRVLPLIHGVYATPSYLKKHGDSPQVLLFRGDDAEPEWVAKHFPGAPVAMRIDNVSVMLTAVLAGLGVARMPCFIGDHERRVRRLELDLAPSSWGIWVLTHADLRSTARVRVAREYLADIIENRRELILGENSRYA